MTWKPKPVAREIFLGDGTLFQIGAYVRSESDERHVGRIERMTFTGKAVVRWANGVSGYHWPAELSLAPGEMIGFD